MSAFAEGTEESLGRRLQWHTIAVTSLSLYFPFLYISIIAVHILNDRLKEFFEEVVREKAGRDAATKTAKDKIKATNSAKKRAAAMEKAWALAKK